MSNFNADKFMINTASADLRQFMSPDQLITMRVFCKGEEGVWFITKMVELAAMIHTMPKTYEQDGLGDQAIASLHYFKGSCDWYITEKDIDADGEGQVQAFGYANLGDDESAELGYISIPDILTCGAELDLHFTPRTLASVKERQAARA